MFRHEQLQIWDRLLVSQTGSYIFCQQLKQGGASVFLPGGFDWLLCSMNSLWNKHNVTRRHVCAVAYPTVAGPPNNATADGSSEPPRSLVHCQSSLSNTSNLVHGRRTC